MRGLDTERIASFSRLCWVKSSRDDQCRNRGKHWVRWNDFYPSIHVCGVHVNRPAMSREGGRYPEAEPLQEPGKEQG